VTSLAEIAHRLNLSAGGAGRLPPMILMTDDTRLAFPAAAIGSLPRGSAVILRHYDDPGREALGRRILAVCRDARVRLLIAGDARLASRLGADGLHLPEWMVRRGLWRGWRRPGWLVTSAAHSPAALWHARRAGADAALLAPVFHTASHPGDKPLGALRFAAWCRVAPLPVYALGGVTAETAGRLAASPAAGLAAISGLTPGGTTAGAKKRGAAKAAPP
jgi:thiamine-phosphate pyrophosphorylase